MVWRADDIRHAGGTGETENPSPEGVGWAGGQTICGSISYVLELPAVHTVCVQGTTATTHAAAVARLACSCGVVAALGRLDGEEGGLAGEEGGLDGEEGGLDGEEGGTTGTGGAIEALETRGIARKTQDAPGSGDWGGGCGVASVVPIWAGRTTMTLRERFLMTSGVARGGVWPPF